MLFSAESGAMAIINQVMAKYESYFQIGFSLYEYLNITRSENYDFSVKGAYRVKKLIDGCLETGIPVDTPDDYHDRIY